MKPYLLNVTRVCCNYGIRAMLLLLLQNIHKLFQIYGLIILLLSNY